MESNRNEENTFHYQLSTPPSYSDILTYIALLSIFLLLALLVLVLLIGGTFIVQCVLSTPFVPTSSRMTKAMVEIAELKGNEMVYDLGAGDGRVLAHAKRLYPHLRTIGIENMPTVVWWGRLRLWLTRSRRVELRCANALRVPVSDADVIFLYLMPGLLEKLEKKFDAELRSGTKVISNTFRFPHRTPMKEEMVGGKRLLVYVW